MSKLKVNLSGVQSLFAAAILFAITNVLVREISTMWGDQAQVAARFALVWIILISFIPFSKKKASIPKTKLLPAVAYSVLAGLAILFFTISIQSTSIANTLFTSNATELFVAFLLGTILLRESLSAKKIIAIVLALIGLLLYADSILAGSMGIIFGLLGGATTAFCNILAKKLKGVDSNAILRMQFGVGAILMIALTFIFSPNDIIRTVSVEGIVLTVLFAIILIFATRFVLYGFQNTDINIASVILSSQLAIGALLGLIFFQETLAPHEIVSGILITIAAVIGSFAQKPTPKDIHIHP